MLSEEDFLPWAQAYRRWHSADYKPWREHRIAGIPKFKDVPIGKLTEEEIDKLRTFVGKGTKTVQGLLNKEGQRTQAEMAFIADVTYLGHAIRHLDDYRSKMGAGAAPTTPVPEAKKEQSTPAQPTEAVEGVNGQELVELSYITNAEKFVNYTLEARQQLSKRANDLSTLEAVIRHAGALQRLARAIEVTKDVSIQATAYECDARYERARLIEDARKRGEIKEGRGSSKKPGTPLTEVLPSKNDQNWNATLAKLSPEEYQKRLDEGMESKMLSEKTFRLKKQNSGTTGNSKKQSKQQREHKGPHDFLLTLCVDMRNNSGSYPTEGEYFERFVADKVLMENFLKVAPKLKEFIMKLAIAGLRGRLDEHAHERAMAEPSDFP
jgi:hypothetical protein